MKPWRTPALRTFVALLAGAILAASAYPAPAETSGTKLTIEDAVRIALKEHPAVSIASANERVAASRVLEAKGAWFPALEATESYTRGDNPVFVFGSLLEQGRFGSSNFDPRFLNQPPALQNYRAALSLRYPLFDQLRRVGAGEEASYGVAVASMQSGAVRQWLTLEVLRKFYGAELATEEQSVAREAVVSAQADVKRTRDRVETGLLVLSDLLAAEVQLAAFRQREVAAAGELEIARRALATSIGRPHERLEPASSLVAIEFPLGNLEELLASGGGARSDVHVAELEQRIAASKRRTATAAALPRVDVFANWGASGQSFSQHKADHTVGFVASWKVPGLTVRAERARAAEEVISANARQAETTNAAELEIVTAWEHSHSAAARQSIAAESIAQADETSRIVRDRYEQGLTSITEVLRAQTSVVEARLLNLRAIYDQYISYAQLLQATGRLDSVQPFMQSPNPKGASR